MKKSTKSKRTALALTLMAALLLSAACGGKTGGETGRTRKRRSQDQPPKQEEKQGKDENKGQAAQASEKDKQTDEITLYDGTHYMPGQVPTEVSGAESDKLAVTQHIRLDDYSSEHVLLVKNNSEKLLSVRVNIVYTGEDGEQKENSGSIWCVGPGNTSFQSILMPKYEKLKDLKYVLIAQEEPADYNADYSSEVEHRLERTSDDLVLTLTSKAEDSFDCTALLIFRKNGQPVQIQWCTFYEDGGLLYEGKELKANYKDLFHMAKDMSEVPEYDDYEIYYQAAKSAPYAD